MILLNLNKPAPALLCPHCEEPMSEHDGMGACRRSKVSRRFFLGGLGMAAAGTVAGLAFTQQAQAALEDTVAEPVLSAVPELAEKGVESVIVKAEPKVHRGGAIVLTYEGHDPQMQMDRPRLQEIADREGRMVIFRNNGVVHTASPSDTAFENKWQRPSIAREPRVWTLDCDKP